MTETIYALTALGNVTALIIALIILLVFIRPKTNRRNPRKANLAAAASAVGKALEAGAAELRAKRPCKQTPARGDVPSPASNGS